MNSIHIDTKPFAKDLYYSGVFKDNENTEYEFTLTEHDNGISIAWLNDSPKFAQATEDIIIEQFTNNR